MDMSQTGYWNESSLRQMKYESCSPSSDTTPACPTPLLPPPPHRHPFHHHHHHHVTASTAQVAPSPCYNSSSTDSNTATNTSPSGSQLNFACTNEDMDCGEYGLAYRGGGGGRSGSGSGASLGIGSSNRISRQDPLSHRIIEKRRRDRMNNCLADLSRLIPAEYLKKGRGRVEKTEIIEMAIMHMKYLQHMNHYSLGYQDCMSETLRFLVEVEGQFPRSPLCVRLLAHLQQHRDAVCVRRSSGGSTSSTSHSPVGGLNPIPGTLGGTTTEGAMAAMVLGTNGTSYDLIGPSTNTSCTSPPPPLVKHTTTTTIPNMANPLKPPKLEPNNNEEDYNSSTSLPHSVHHRLSHEVTSPSLIGDEEGEEEEEEELDEAQQEVEVKCLVKELHQQQERHSEGYKYKNDIKLRFSQDVRGVVSVRRRDSDNGSEGNHSCTSPPSHPHPHHHHQMNDMCQLSTVIGGNTTTAMCKMSQQLKSPNDSNSESSCGDVKVNETFTVPIFALHSKGTFYVPLTVDYRALLPYLGAGVDLATWPQDGAGIVLHPVAINVNFSSIRSK